MSPTEATFRHQQQQQEQNSSIYPAPQVPYSDNPQGHQRISSLSSQGMHDEVGGVQRGQVGAGYGPYAVSTRVWALGHSRSKRDFTGDEADDRYGLFCVSARVVHASPRCIESTSIRRVRTRSVQVPQQRIVLVVRQHEHEQVRRRLWCRGGCGSGSVGSSS